MRHFLLFPFRFAIRRPRRAALLLVTALVFLSAAVAGAGLVWFYGQLDAAREDARRWHNTEAVKHLSNCNRLWSDHPEVLLLSSRVARRMGAWTSADDFLARYAKKYGEDERLSFERLLHRASQGELESTMAALKAHAVEGGPNSRLAREAMIIGLTRRFLWQEARMMIAAWLSESPDDPVALLFLGKVLEEQKGLEEAIQTYRRVISLDMGQVEARLRLASLLVVRRHGDEALAIISVLRNKLPDHPEVQVLWAQSLALVGRGSEARAAIDEALKAYPDNPGALMEKGGYALLDGDEKSAVEYLRRAAQLDPGNPIARNQYALALARSGNLEESKKEYEKIRQLEADSTRVSELVGHSLQQRPNDPAIHYEIATIALRSGQIQEALRWFESALRVDPNHLPTHAALADLYFQLDNPILAARHRAIAQQLASKRR
jgi:tetratricopeptide (TPR) repeat protein